MKSKLLVLGCIVIILSTYYNCFCLEKGFKFGLNVSNLTNQGIIDSKFSPSFSLGIFSSFQIHNKIFLQPELYFSDNSIDFDGRVIQQFDNDNDGHFDEDVYDLIDNDNDGQIDEDDIELFYDGKGDINLKSVELPIFFRYLAYSPRSMEISLFIGSSFRYIFSRTIDIGENLIEELKFSEDKFDLSGIIGVNWQFHNLIIDFRFTNSLLNNEWIVNPGKYAYPYPDDLVASGFYPLKFKSSISVFSMLVGIVI